MDSYSITVKKEDTIRVTVKAAELGLPLDPVLEVRDPKGASLKVVDDSTRNQPDVVHSWKVTADGEYQIQVSDRFQHGGWDYAYLLTVEKSVPDFRLSVARDALALTSDKPLEFPVTVNRMGRIAEKIEVQVTGLPEGITAEPVISEPKGATAKSVKLKLTAKDKTPFHGPVWITGKGGDIEQTASTTIPLASPKAQHLWVTFEPKK